MLVISMDYIYTFIYIYVYQRIIIEGLDLIKMRILDQFRNEALF